MPVMPAGCCHHTDQCSGAAKKVCNVRADGRGHHAVLCKIGGVQHAAHGQGSHILLQAAQQAGFQARRKQVMPELASSNCQSPQLGVEGWGLLGQQRLLVDFTVRHPFAVRYAKALSPTAVAEGEKDHHCRPQQGLVVRTAALEVFGRHGAGLVDLLESWADCARQRERSLGLATTSWFKRLRAHVFAWQHSWSAGPYRRPASQPLLSFR